MQRQRFCVGSLLAPVLLIGGTTTACLAQTETAPEDPNTGALHFELGADWLSAYYFRGLLQEDSGFILQPWLDVGIELTEGDDWSLTGNIGIWNSIHGDDDTAGTTDNYLKHLYETDWYAGLGLDIGSWSLGATYVLYTSPSDAFGTIGEVDLSAGYDDSSLWGDSGFALNPSVTAAFEVDDDAGSEDAYLQLGIEPGASYDLSGTTIDFAFPVVVGLSLDDYYLDSNGDEDFFGYVETGIDASIPLGVPARYGAWSLNGGVHLLFLGDAAETVNNGDDFEVVGHLGLSISY